MNGGAPKSFAFGSQLVPTRKPKPNLWREAADAPHKFPMSKTVTSTTLAPNARATRRAISSPFTLEPRRDGTEAVPVAAISVNQRHLLYLLRNPFLHQRRVPERRTVFLA